MNKIEKVENVILELETCLTSSCRGKSGYCQFSDDVLNAIRDAVEHLKTQVPVKPYEMHGEYECGFCRNEVRPDEHTFCPCCGRKVNWE